jgi:hypothetical protein
MLNMYMLHCIISSDVDQISTRSKVEHATHGSKTRPKAQWFGPIQARHGPILIGPGPARST